MTPIESMNGNDIRKYKMAMTVLATMRGIPQLYYGSEIGMAGNKDKGMQLFVKIFQVGMAMQTMHLPKKDELQPKTNTLILAKLFTGAKAKQLFIPEK
jgi:glycosidase